MGRNQQYAVCLSEAERTWLRHFINPGDSGARPRQRAHMVVLASEGKHDREVAEALHASLQTVGKIRKKSATGGLEMALPDRPRRGGARKLTAKGAATLIALAWSDPPDGRADWTMPLLADKLIAREVGESIADETVRRARKKTP